ncbi:MAG: hypothetical protein AB7N73_12585 [Gemmatimonadales bacterium]
MCLATLVGLFGPDRAAAQQLPADTTWPGLGVHAAFPLGLAELRMPRALELPRPSERGSPAALLARFNADLEAGLARERLRASRERVLRRLYGGDSLALAVGLPERDVPKTREIFGISTDLVDVAIDGQVSLQVTSERFENLRCTSFQLQDPVSGCRPKFTAPRIENQVLLNLSGVIGQRLRVDVDLDTQRDYNNANTIRAYYQGLQDEVIQRVDVGTVQFQPPPSRFLTAGIPTNNFGISTRIEYGPLAVQALAATQSGSVVADRTYRIGDQTVEPQDRLLRDLDYETGRFFWVTDPRTLPGYPRIDPLTLDQLQLPAGVRPTDVRIYRYRAAGGSQGVNPNLGGILALGLNDFGTTPQQVGPLQWELLVRGQDYWQDPSGLWFVLNAKLDPNDFLAVSYLREDGSRVGTFPARDNPLVSDTLQLVVEPNRAPDAGTYHFAMRNVYRVAGADLDRSSLGVAVLLNRSERPEGDVSTWLQRFGLAIPTDQAVFDTDNRLFPRPRDPGAVETIRDQFVVFPNLTPFGDPQLVADPAVRNDSLYRTPEYLLFTQGPPAKFNLRLSYVATGGGDRSTLLLNATQIREETEQIFVEGRRLARGIDYSVNYDLGQVTFLDPDALFGNRPATVTARFEQRGFFAIAPTSIFGLTTRYQLGEWGGINLVGLYQREATAFNRPPLGFEPTASLIGGVSTDLRFDVPSVSRFVDRFTSGRMTARSTLDIDAEVAFSRPDPNRSGEAFLDEFEDDQGIPISLRENAWSYGSRPASANGLEALGFAAGFDSTDAVQLTWQNLIPDGRGGARDLRPTDIDTNIVIRGGNSIGTETVLYMTFHADTAGGVVARDNSAAWSLPRRDFRPRWRSLVTPLSLTGRDLSRNEFLEFWVFEGADRPVTSNDMRLVIDLGTVSEDALALAPQTFTVSGGDTTFTGRGYAGVGMLDTERSPTGTFNALTDDIGILGDRPLLTLPDGGEQLVPLCRRSLSNLVEVFPWGDLSARCSVGNGVLDTEDLDGDLLLDARGPTEDVFRYVVDLNDPKYFVRTGVQAVDPTDSTRVAGWRLYRVPLRDVDRTIGQPNIRLVKHLRVTLATPPDNGLPDPVIRFALARMRLVGAPWIARADAPIEGLDGALAQPRGEVAVSSISTENIELGYVSPPGLGSTLNQVNTGATGLGVQVNEKSLRTVVRDLRFGERAEAYTRFSNGAQNLLAYRELRVWMRGRGDGWDDGRLRAFIKVGTDDENFYYFEAPAGTMSWTPELVVDLETWRRLRAEVETRFLRGDPPSGAESCGGDPEAWVACDGGYVVHVRNPTVNPPNLAAVQEIAAGIRYAVDGLPIAETELWTDDVRLAQPITDVGVATAFSARLVAGDVGTMSLQYVSQDGNFRQIGQAPSYRTTRALSGLTTVQLDRFLPAELGLVMPMTVNFNRQSVAPELITGSDVRGSDLDGLRRPRNGLTTVTLSARRVRTTGPLLVRALVNPVSLSANLSSRSAATEYSESDGNSWGVSLTWDRQFTRRGIPLGLGGTVGRLPGWFASSAAGRGIANAQFNPVPTTLRFTSNLSRTTGNVTAFLVPIERIEDTLLIPQRSIQHLWTNSAVTSWQPLGMLTVGGTWSSTRDLREYDDSTTLGRLTGQSRRTFAGIDVGVERDRQVGTSFALTPTLSSWLRPRFTSGSNFVLSRNLTTRNPVRVDGDTAGAYILPQTLNNSRTNEIGATVEPATLVRRLFGDSAGITRFLARVQPVDARWNHTYTSTYDLAAFDPGTGYQLGLGGLDQFLRQDGTSAIGAAEVISRQADAAFDLPFGLTATGRYRATDADRYQRAGTGSAAETGFLVTTSRQVDWPDLTLRWSRTSIGPFTLIMLSGNVRDREIRATVPAFDPDAPPSVNQTRSQSFRPDLQLIFRNGVQLSGGFEVSDGDRLANGRRTLRNQLNWNATASWAIRLPGAVSGLRRPLTTTLSATGFSSDECLEAEGGTECTVISDISRTDYRLSFGTNVVGSVRGELSGAYVLNEIRHLERRTSTLSLSMVLTIPISSLGGI